MGRFQAVVAFLAWIAPHPWYAESLSRGRPQINYVSKIMALKNRSKLAVKDRQGSQSDKINELSGLVAPARSVSAEVGLPPPPQLEAEEGGGQSEMIPGSPPAHVYPWVKRVM